LLQCDRLADLLPDLLADFVDFASQLLGIGRCPLGVDGDFGPRSRDGVLLDRRRGFIGGDGAKRDQQRRCGAYEGR
jgi:hypothetical protein